MFGAFNLRIQEQTDGLPPRAIQVYQKSSFITRKHIPKTPTSSYPKLHAIPKDQNLEKSYCACNYEVAPSESIAMCRRWWGMKNLGGGVRAYMSSLSPLSRFEGIPCPLDATITSRELESAPPFEISLFWPAWITATSEVVVLLLWLRWWCEIVWGSP